MAEGGDGALSDGAPAAVVVRARRLSVLFEEGLKLGPDCREQVTYPLCVRVDLLIPKREVFMREHVPEPAYPFEFSV